MNTNYDNDCRSQVNVDNKKPPFLFEISRCEDETNNQAKIDLISIIINSI